MAEIEQGILIRVTAEGQLVVTKLAEAFKELEESANDAGASGANMGNSMSQLSPILQSISNHLVGLAASYLGLGAAMRLARDGIRQFDATRDITRAIASMTGSLKEAEATMKFFESAANRTRSTNTDLARTFQEVLPIAIRRGLLPQLKEIVVQLDQVATQNNKTLGEMVSGFRMLLMRGPTTRNPLMAALGLTAEDVKKSTDGMQLVLDKIKEVAAKGATAGESFASMGVKVRDAFVSAFAEGFAKSFGPAAQGIDNLKKALTDPTLVEAIKTIGSAFADIMRGPVAEILKAVGRIISDIKDAARWVGEHIGAGHVPGLGLPDPIKEENDRLERLQRMRDPNRMTFLSPEELGLGNQTIKLVPPKGPKTDISDWWGESGKEWISDVQKSAAAVEDLKKQIEAWTKAGAPAEFIANKYKDTLAAMREEAIALGKALDPTIKYFDDLNKELAHYWDLVGKTMTGFGGQNISTFAGMVGAHPGLDKPVTAWNPIDPEAYRKMVEEGAKLEANIRLNSVRMAALEWRVTIGKSTTDTLEVMGQVFADFAREGGNDFGLAAVTAIHAGLKSMTPEMSKVFGSAIMIAFGAKKIDPNAPEYQEGGAREGLLQSDQAKFDAQAQGVSQAITGAFGMVLQSLNTIKNMQAGQQVDVATSIIGGAVSGASIGTAIGGWALGLGTVIGAIVGAIIGGITAAIANAKAKAMMAWADFGIEMGQAYIRASSFPSLEGHFKNVTEKDIADFYEQVAKTMDEVTTNFIDLLLKFPEDVLDAIGAFPDMSAFSSKFKPGSKWGTTTPDNYNTVEYLRNFAGNLQLWVENQLPRDIAEAFKAPVSQAFQLMGMTEDQFTIIWNRLQGMDPKDAMQILQDTADALISFRDVWDTMANLRKSNALVQLGANGLPRVQGNDFMNQLANSSDAIKDLLDRIAEMPLKEQAAAAAQLGASLQEIMTSLVDYLNRLAAASKALSDSIASAKFEAGYGQLTDKKAQSDYLYAQYERNLKLLKNPIGLNEQDITRLTNENIGLLKRIYDLNPTKAVFDWWMAQLDYLDTVQIAAFTTLGEQAKTAVELLLKQVEPFTDYIKGLPADMDPAFAAVSDSLFNFSDELDRLSARLAGDEGVFGGGSTPGQPPGGPYQPHPYGTGTAWDPYRDTPELPPGTPAPPAPPRGRLTTDDGTQSSEKRVTTNEITVNVNGPVYDGRDLANIVVRTLRRNPGLLEPNS